MNRFDGRVAVVTGAASGIGRALADRFAAAGMKVVLADVEQAPLDQAVEELRTNGHEAIGVLTDVSRLGDVQALADRTIKEFGAVHVLCNNAGVESGGAIADVPLATWRWVLDVNLFGVIHGCNCFLPLLRQQDEAHVVNTGSLASLAAGIPTMGPYVASKWGILALSEQLAYELAATGDTISVSVLLPGLVSTRMPDAERNRPAEVPSSAADPARTALLEGLKQMSEQVGLKPSAVADQVFDAVRERKFWVMTHPDEAVDLVVKRLSWMRTGEMPAPSV